MPINNKVSSACVNNVSFIVYLETTSYTVVICVLETPYFCWKGILLYFFSIEL